MVLWCIEFSKGSDGKCNICAVLDNFNRGRISFDKNPLFRVIIMRGIEFLCYLLFFLGLSQTLSLRSKQRSVPSRVESILILTNT